MKTRLLALVAMFFVMHGLVQGQPRVAEIPSLQTDISIVRYWQNEYSVAYAWDARGTNCFMLIDRNSTSVKRIDVPSGVRVNDFRIMHDSVYLGGQIVVGGVNRGLLASFSLHDVMSGAGNFNYAVMLPSPLSDFWDTPRLNDQVADVKRIALYEFEGRVNVAYIADNYIGRDSVRIGHGWAAYDATSGSWRSNLMYNKHGREVYTDIMTTDDYVVALGREIATSKLVMRAYRKFDFMNPDVSDDGIMFLPLSTVKIFADALPEEYKEMKAVDDGMPTNVVALVSLQGTSPFAVVNEKKTVICGN